MKEQRIKIDTEFIKLDQLLKLSNQVSTGGDAKVCILSEEVKVNGEIETRRGKKIRSGDKVEINGELIVVE